MREIWLQTYAGAPNCYLNMLGKLCRTDDPTLVAFVESLVRCRNIVSLGLFWRYYLGICSSKLAELIPFPNFLGRSTRYSDELRHSPVTIPAMNDIEIHVNNFFLCAVTFWNSFPAECFPLNCNVLWPSPYQSAFLQAFIPCFLLFLVISCLAVANKPCLDKPD